MNYCGHAQWKFGHCADIGCANYINKCPKHTIYAPNEKGICPHDPEPQETEIKFTYPKIELFRVLTKMVLAQELGNAANNDLLGPNECDSFVESCGDRLVEIIAHGEAFNAR